MNEDAWYPSENILVHEFAHSVMSIGMNEDQRQAVLGAYFNARANQLYKKDCYMMASADEYWAEGAQSWFEATIRTGQPLPQLQPSMHAPLQSLTHLRNLDPSQVQEIRTCPETLWVTCTLYPKPKDHVKAAGIGRNGFLPPLYFVSASKSLSATLSAGEVGIQAHDHTPQIPHNLGRNSRHKCKAGIYGRESLI